ncbi:MAG: T9SS type A sorting domain-containing protein [Prolixibacteraceae bacterium]
MYIIKISLLFLLTTSLLTVTNAQEIKITVQPENKFQTVEGFGAALAYYENWLTSHPNKTEIYEAIFGELSLDILRVRNAYDYDAGMVARVKEFITASEKVRGNPIPFLTTSWGPPAYLKSNNDRNNGGTLKYTVSDGKVQFDYNGFANWWNASLDNYEANGISPSYISIQNEPDWKASYESCLLNPFEKVNSTDTLAGYNKALQAVHDMVAKRSKVPKMLGPECIGIGYNAVKNYVLQLDTTLLTGIAHHLYHGIDVNNPWDNTEMTNLNKLYPNLKLYQTEYSGNDWFNLSGLMYKSFADEQAVAYFYWDLAWDNGGLVSMDNPWSSGTWKTTKGYSKTKEFYAFKQFSAFVQPGWQRVEVTAASTAIESVAFMSPGQDSLSVIVINRSTVGEKEIRFELSGFEFTQSNLFATSSTLNCEPEGELNDSTATLSAKSINTALFIKTFKDGIGELKNEITNALTIYPNPLRNKAQIKGVAINEPWQLYSMDGSLIQTGSGTQLDASELMQGMYLLKTRQKSVKLIKQ